jgi:predicted acylesterase/phospholipase RssA
LATAIRASACFPVLFSPVMVDGWPHIDGGVCDTVGMMALPGIPEDSRLIVNVINGNSQLSHSVVPEQYPNAKLLTIVLNNIPSVNPLSIETCGPLAYK